MFRVNPTPTQTVNAFIGRMRRAFDRTTRLPTTPFTAATRRLASWGATATGARRLNSTLLSPVDNQTAMIVGRPLWRYPLAVANPEPGMRPLLEAIGELPLDCRPFRIVSHEAEDGRVFNSTFFDSDAHTNAFLQWCVLAPVTHVPRRSDLTRQPASPCLEGTTRTRFSPARSTTPA